MIEAAVFNIPQEFKPKINFFFSLYFQIVKRKMHIKSKKTQVCSLSYVPVYILII